MNNVRHRNQTPFVKPAHHLFVSDVSVFLIQLVKFSFLEKENSIPELGLDSPVLRFEFS